MNRRALVLTVIGIVLVLGATGASTQNHAEARAQLLVTVTRADGSRRAFGCRAFSYDPHRQAWVVKFDGTDRLELDVTEFPTFGVVPYR